jgi:hypothetical protein
MTDDRPSSGARLGASVRVLERERGRIHLDINPTFAADVKGRPLRRGASQAIRLEVHSVHPRRAEATRGRRRRREAEPLFTLLGG